MKIESLLGVGALVFALTACASPPADEGQSSAESAMLDGETVAREIPDLDGDGVAESWETRRDLCGSGGCTYTIHLSSHPDETLGEVFGVNFTPFSSLYLDGPPSADTYPTFNAEARGGYCDYSITRMKFDEATRKYVEGSSIDCHAVINRIGGRVAQFEERCFDLIPADECKDNPVPDPLATAGNESPTAP